MFKVHTFTFLACAQRYLELGTRLHLIFSTGICYKIGAHLIFFASNASKANADSFPTRFFAVKRGIDLETSILDTVRLTRITENGVLRVIEMQIASISFLITFVLYATILKTDGSALTFCCWLVQHLTGSECGCLISERSFGTGAAFYNFVTQTIYILFTRRTDLARVSKEMDTNVVIMFTSHIHSECL
jgi:hypothetical protein